MLGAITGDTIGSRYEFGANRTKKTDFELFGEGSRFTDDTVMTMAVAQWLLDDKTYSHGILEQKMVEFGHQEPHRGYGGMFRKWLLTPYLLNEDGVRRPYRSFGNGSAMRVSAVGWMFDTLEETEHIAEISASITHNHPEGVKGAQSVAAAIFMARNGKSKQDIRSYISEKYGYDLSFTCDEIRPDYDFDSTCQGSVPEAIIAFLDSNDYESAVRLAVSLGGDADTQACIAGGIAEAYYGMPDNIVAEMANYLSDYYKTIILRFAENSHYRCRLEQIKRCWKG